MLTRIGHPCVHNNKVGLDMLTVRMERGTKSKASQSPPKNSERYRMWSPSYTVVNILVQLQGKCVQGSGVCVCVFGGAAVPLPIVSIFSLHLDKM